MSKKDDVKQKIIDLRKRVPENGATEGEAMVFLEKAASLMEKYGITEADLQVVEAARDMSEVTVTRKFKALHPVDKYCSILIGDFCGVVAWNSTRYRAMKGFGFNADVEMFEFLTIMIRGSMDRGWKDYLKENPPNPEVTRHTEYWSFALGFCDRINDKLEALLKKRRAQEKKASTGTELIVKKMAIVEAGMKELLPGLKLRSSSSRGIQADPSAYVQGSIAGDKVNLNRPLDPGKGSRKQIS